MIDLQSLLFNIEIDSDAPRRGSLLVSEPFLKEQYFNHSVICLVDYEPQQEAMGIVLNKPTSYTLCELVESVDRESNITVYCGGPLSCDRLYFIHRLGDFIPNSKEIVPELWIGGDFGVMIDYVNSGYPVDGNVRFFIGYSGWGVEQLDGELRKNVWAVTQIPDITHLLVGGDDGYWHRTVRSMGRPYRSWLYHPQNPRVN